MNKIIKMGLIFLMLIIGSIGVYAGCHDGTSRLNYSNSYEVAANVVQNINVTNMTRMNMFLNITPIEFFIVNITQNFTLTAQDSDYFECRQQLPNQTSPGDNTTGGWYPTTGLCSLAYSDGDITCTGSRCTSPSANHEQDKAFDNDWTTYFDMVGVNNVQLEFEYAYPFDDITTVANITWNLKFMNGTGNYTYNITLPYNCTNNITWEVDLIVRYVNPDYYQIGCWNGAIDTFTEFLHPDGVTLAGIYLYEQQVFWNVSRVIGGREIFDYRYINLDSVRLYNRTSGQELGDGNFSVHEGYTFGTGYIQTDNIAFDGMPARMTYTRNFSAGGGLWNRDDLIFNTIYYNTSNIPYIIEYGSGYNIDNNVTSNWTITDEFIGAAQGNWTAWYQTYDMNCTNMLPSCSASFTGSPYNTTTNISVTWGWYDPDGDPFTDNTTQWYLGGVLLPAETNLTTLVQPNTAGSYLFSGRVKDTYNWSDWCNATFTVTPPTTTTTTMSAASSCNNTRGVVFAGFALMAVIMIVVAAFGIISIFSGNFNVGTLMAILIGMVGFGLTVIIGYVVIGNLSAITCAI
jgi:hypothetical protein